MLHVVGTAVAAQYRVALPGYRYEFPRDHFSHPEFQTEWWYYTGNLASADGHRFGFELTFFRQAVSRDPAKTAAWDVKDLYLAHLALSDLDGGKFYHVERANRSGPGIAGVSESRGRIWNGNWQIQWETSGQKLPATPQGALQATLQAIDERFQLHLTLHPEKPPVIHGQNGVSQKADGPGRASHYISLTRLMTSGSIELAGKTFEVSGTSWMDHEFFTHQLEPGQTGWDWLSLQLADRTELMLFHIRRKDGSIDAYSAGTYVDAHGKTTHLRASDFTLQPLGEKWTSPVTRATYPIAWKIVIPKLGIELEATTPLASQELTSHLINGLREGTAELVLPALSAAEGSGAEGAVPKGMDNSGASAPEVQRERGQTVYETSSRKTNLAPSYWEGAIVLADKRNAQPLAGVGYLEMTGYDRPVHLAP